MRRPMRYLLGGAVGDGEGLMPLIQPERRRTGSPALAMSGMESTMALKMSSISRAGGLDPGHGDAQRADHVRG
jgi:hypothetical protein